jgi:hypothetical protein
MTGTLHRDTWVTPIGVEVSRPSVPLPNSFYTQA